MQILMKEEIRPEDFYHILSATSEHHMVLIYYFNLKLNVLTINSVSANI
jgi:hypothetical protein